MFRSPTPAQPQTSSRQSSKVAVRAEQRTIQCSLHSLNIRQLCYRSANPSPCKPAQPSKQACRATAGSGTSDSSDTNRPSQQDGLVQNDPLSQQGLPSVPWGWGTILKVCAFSASMHRQPRVIAVCISQLASTSRCPGITSYFSSIRVQNLHDERIASHNTTATYRSTRSTLSDGIPGFVSNNIKD